jgi:hypothetical protein
VVVLGGDGFYVEVLQGLMQQTQDTAGVDPNDPDASLVPPPIPIGIIPTGRKPLFFFVNSNNNKTKTVCFSDALYQAICHNCFSNYC